MTSNLVYYANMKYNPNIHAGLLEIAGQQIIVADAKAAKLDEMPLEYRKAIAEQTRISLALLDGIPGLLETNLTATEIEERRVGFQKGLALLKLPEDNQ